MKINIVSRKLIKPCTPTPQNLKSYKISFKDELNSPMNVGIILIYHWKPKFIGQLEESLSKILPRFYPLAGRYIKRDHYVDCSDQGAEFVEALVADDVGPTDVLDSARLDELVPRRCDDQVDGVDDPLLSVQITELIECGALVIGISLSHRIFDGSSIGTFIKAWSKANMNPEGRLTIVPSFDSLLLFPGKNINYHKDFERSRTTIVAKRFVFKMEIIMNLKSKLRPENGVAYNALSRVRVVCAVVAKALIHMDQKIHQRSRPCLMVQSVNMRQRTIPPFPKHSCGNLVLHAVADYDCMQPSSDVGIEQVVYILTDAIGKTVSTCMEIFMPGGDCYDDLIIKPETALIDRSKSREVNGMWFTDWSKLGLYEADFGWGNPISVGVVPMPLEKLTVLMNCKDGEGIEAWVHLSESDMSYFEEDEGIKLTYLQPNYVTS